MDLDSGDDGADIAQEGSAFPQALLNADVSNGLPRQALPVAGHLEWLAFLASPPAEQSAAYEPR